jgi:hypothetical protein
MGFKTSVDSGGVNDPNRNQKVHPVWRAVGCFMALLIPIIGFTGALMLLEANQEQGWVVIPYDFVAPGQDPLLYVKIGLTAVLSFILYTIFMMITFFINSAFGPKKYGPTDAPQQRYTGSRYKR